MLPRDSSRSSNPALTAYPYVGKVHLPMKTEGARLLADIFAENDKWNPTTLGDHLCLSRQAVSYWADGTTRPTTDRQAKIEDLLGIPMRAWAQAQSRASKRTGTDG